MLKRTIAILLAVLMLCITACAETVLPGLTYESTMETIYATQFTVEYYEGGYKLITVYDSYRYLLIPEGADVPAGLDSDIIILQMPLDNIYLAATSAMALFDAVGSVGAITLSSQTADAWYIDNAVQAMNDGEMVYAGKYSEPDYELLISKNCSVAIESTMILHTPKVQEMIELLGIPVFIDYSSYEKHPLGRMEWVKLYAAMVDREAEAEEFFAGQAAVIEELKDFPNTEKVVVFFAMSSDGSINVRTSDDYIPKMIEIAGGRYAFTELTNDESNRATINITMEQFYSIAVNADYLIYNAAIESPITSIDDLIAKDALFADFKAVREGNVWTTDRYLYQATDIVGQLILDINGMLTGQTEGMTFIKKLS